MDYSFNLNDETICDYQVSSLMKRVWAKQLEMVDIFAKICKNHNLKWFASGGTLLGAVRHQGYIPWDDDIDIHMLDSEYEIFCQVAPNELPEGFFWQEYRTQYGFGPKHGKIRNSDTTGCTQYEYYTWPDDMNKGIFIDIFPLQYIPRSHITRLIQLVGLTITQKMTNLYAWNRANILSKKPEKKPLFQLLYKIIYSIFDYQKICRVYKRFCNIRKKPSKYVGALSFNFKEPRFVWPTENYREMVDLPFMGGTIKCPIEWDLCLKQQFGDYNVIVKGGSMHSKIIFDVDTPYSVLIPEMRKREDNKDV